MNKNDVEFILGLQVDDYVTIYTTIETFTVKTDYVLASDNYIQILKHFFKGEKRKTFNYCIPYNQILMIEYHDKV